MPPWRLVILFLVVIAAAVVLEGAAIRYVLDGF